MIPTTGEISLGIQVVTIVGSVIGSVGASILVTYSWVRAKFAANDVEITNIKQRIDQHCESGIREGSLLGRELLEMRNEASAENKEIKRLVTDIRINVASHDGVLKNLDELMKYFIHQKNE